MIVCFSGTGNTLHVARQLSALTGLDIVRLEGEALFRPGSVTLHSEENEDVVWAFPTYSWGIPPVVVDFMKECGVDDSVGNARHFMLTTCGDDMAQTDRQWRRIMTRRGFRPVAAFSVVMPNTYVCMTGFDVDSPETVREKLDASVGRVAAIAEAIAAGGPDMLHRGSFAWIKSRIIYPWFVRHSMSPKPFHCTDDCVGCGTCARLCPMENIIMEKNENGALAPSWADKCALCLRCYHACPYHAVAYGRTTRGKGRQWLGLR